MIVSIMQPAYLPWLGYFDRIARSDVHIVLDHVEIDRSSKTKFANRNRVRVTDGWTWLTVPIRSKGASSRLNEIEIHNELQWGAKHWRTIQNNYARAPHFRVYADYFEHLFSCRWDRLVDLLDESTGELLRQLGIETPMLKSSKMAVDGKKDRLILNLCELVGAETYVSGPLGRDYLRKEAFRRAGIELVFQHYVHPTYEQVQGGFEPFMSVIDLLLNCGERSLEILTGGQDPHVSG